MPNCDLTGVPFSISEAEREYCARFGVPLPRQSPAERLRGVLAYRSRPFLVPSVCALSKKRILSMVPPEFGFTVYGVDVWDSDEWDPLSFGREYDFGRPFFEQFGELLRAVPLPALAVMRSSMENSDFTNGITGAKNCYLLFSASYNEDCMFSHTLLRTKSSLDSVFLIDCELCYESEDLRNCYAVKFSEHCLNCSESAFLFNCQSCKNCYGCANLNQKQYCFFNEQLSREEYERRVSEIDLGSRKNVLREHKRARDFARHFPQKYYSGKSIIASSGNYIANVKNCPNSYFLSECEDCENSFFLNNAKSAFVQMGYGNNSELVYNTVTAGDAAYNIRFCADCWNSVQDIEYSIFCINGAAHVFGSVGLKRSSYCVLNREYSKDEYFDLTARIRKQMIASGEYGRFFPPALTPFYYNESDAQQSYPLDGSAAIKLGYRWKESGPVAEERMESVPDHIRDADDGVLEKTFRCSMTGKPYRILKQELAFYRGNNIPLPNIAPLERIKNRLGFFELAPLRSASCAKCSAPFETVLAGAAPLYCEECFQKEIY